MEGSVFLSEVYLDSFTANIYTDKPFRMIGLIDVVLEFDYKPERVSLAFFRSSGTNSGKIRGLWYPVVGIKTKTGEFTEFTDTINYILANTTSKGTAKKGWLAKSPFFSRIGRDNVSIRGFSNGKHYNKLKKAGFLLRELYEQNRFWQMDSLNVQKLNTVIYSDKIYKNNSRTQKDNFESFVRDIYNEF